MIGKLKGLVDSINGNTVIIDVNGVGYVVFGSTTLLSRLAIGEAVSLIIETHVREDHIHLYGFGTIDERDWFRELTTIKGVGAKVALTILSGLTPDQLHTAIAAQDKAAFSKISGIGPKLAARLLTELKDKIGAIGSIPTISASQQEAVNELAGTTNTIDDAVSALTNLGYGRSDAYQIVAKAASKNPEASVEALIKSGLQSLTL